MGGNTKANRDALIAANPTLQQNANMVIAGRTYVIPPGSGSPTSSSNSTLPAQPAPVAQAPAPAPTPAAAPAAPTTPQYFYTVKPGDSLTKIAVMQLGNADAVPAIMDLNKETLKGKDVIRPNMKLRLPAKPVASAE
jgi:nucleoid-associated protein YgaU